MKRSYSTIWGTLAVLALAATAALADEVKVDSNAPVEPGFGVQANCDLTGYKSEAQTGLQVSVPDNQAAGVTLGPIVVPADGSLIADVIIDLQMTHTWVGDLIVAVGYDELCDGAVDAQAILLCRQRGTGATTPAPCGTGTGFGCLGDLTTASALLFDDAAAAPLAEGVCPNPIPAGCYRPATVGGSPLSAFENLRKGGCWYINVSDRAGGDLGVILGWSVHIKNQTQIGVSQADWGTVKRLYN